MTHSFWDLTFPFSLLFLLFSARYYRQSIPTCQILETMRSNPTAAWDKSSSAQTHYLSAQATKQLAKLAIKHTSKRNAKKDNHSCHKARAWRCKVTFAVSAKQVKLSRIDWI
jgi:hypothetical protein